VTLCHRKHVANTLLERAGVPVPAFALARRNEIPVHLKLPVIVKPSAEDASVGIDNAAVCSTRKALATRLARSSEHYAEVLVQEYVPGREINVGFLGAEVLPLSEISFAKMPESHWPIVSYAAKWQNDSPEYIGTEPVCPAPVDAALERRIVDVARRAWQLLGGEGYGRVDMRIAPDGSPYVLEVNPNPDLSIDAGFARMAEVNGWDYDAMVGQILDEALSRAGHGLATTQLVRQISA
jgi:D-alanine-D-alanine ligase